MTESGGTVESCHLGCRAFRDWTTEHFHAQERPGIVVFHTPERPGPSVTIHTGWGVDGNGLTSTFTTAEDAVTFAKRYFGVTVRVPHTGRSE